MAIKLIRTGPAPYNTRERRQVFLSDAAKVGSSLGSAFNMDDEIEHMYRSWVDMGRPPNVWVGYMIKDGQRCIQIVEVKNGGVLAGAVGEP